MLLSFGTRRHSGIASPAAMWFTLDSSPVAETIMNMHSCPTCVGVHSNGPTTISAALFAATLAALRCAVLIGIQSFGYDRPAAGLAWNALTTTLVAVWVPRFLILT